MAADGLITIRSSYGPVETMNRLEAEVKGKGLDRIRTYRPCGRRHRSRFGPEPDRSSDLRQRQGRHAADAGGPDHRHRPAAQDPGLAGCRRANLALLQRSALARQTAWHRRRRGGERPGRAPLRLWRRPRRVRNSTLPARTAAERDEHPAHLELAGPIRQCCPPLLDAAPCGLRPFDDLFFPASFRLHCRRRNSGAS